MAERDFTEIARLSERYNKDPQSRIFVQLADAYRKNNMIEEAFEVLQKGLEHHPEYPLAHLIMGKCRFDKRMFAQAKESFQKTLEFDCLVANLAPLAPAPDQAAFLLGTFAGRHAREIAGERVGLGRGSRGGAENSRKRDQEGEARRAHTEVLVEFHLRHRESLPRSRVCADAVARPDRRNRSIRQ